MKKATRRTLEALRKAGHRATSLEQMVTIPAKAGRKASSYWSLCFKFASILDLGTAAEPAVRLWIVLRDQVDFASELRGLLSRPNVAADITAAIQGGAVVRAASWAGSDGVTEGSVLRCEDVRLDAGRLWLRFGVHDWRTIDPAPKAGRDDAPKTPPAAQERPEKPSATDRTGG
jgi:hypothetical protein